MARILVVPVGTAAARRAGVPDDLAGRTRVLSVVEGEGLSRGDLLILGEGDSYGVHRADRGRLELRLGVGGDPIGRGSVVAILRKFKG